MGHDPCYICGLNLVDKSRELNGTEDITYRVQCGRCGTYDITQFCISMTKKGSTLPPDLRVRLSYEIRKATDSYERFGVVLDSDIEDIAKRVQLPRPLEQIDNLLAYAAENTALGTRTPPEHVETWGARLGLLNATEQLGFMEAALNGLLDFAKGTNALSVKLMPLGWQRAEELRHKRGSGNQAFVAMWFHADMDKVYDDAMAPALKATGHSPYRVDRGAHNNKIDDEIVSQIRRSKLVIVDTTGTRPSVYFEAGFAMGLGIPVIWSCNSTWVAYTLDGRIAPDNATVPTAVANTWNQQAAFDTRQHPHIFWKDLADLQEQLEARVRALGFDAEWNRST